MDVDDLYALPAKDFVAARGALAKELKAAGEKDRAAEVAALRKPSVAAWAVNQVVRGSPAGLAALVEAGDAVADAQAALVGGGDRAAMRDATAALRAAVGVLVDEAASLDGVGAGAFEAVRETFQAAAVDPQAREQVLGGRLERELRYSGIGVGAGGSATPARPAGKPNPKLERADGPKPAPKARRTAARKRPNGDEDREAVAVERKAAEEARVAEEAREAQAREAEEAAERARVAKARKAAEKALGAAERRVEKAQDRRDRAAATLEKADADLEHAGAEADRARATLEDLD